MKVYTAVGPCNDRGVCKANANAHDLHNLPGDFSLFCMVSPWTSHSVYAISIRVSLFITGGVELRHVLIRQTKRERSEKNLCVRKASSQV